MYPLHLVDASLKSLLNSELPFLLCVCVCVCVSAFLFCFGFFCLSCRTLILKHKRAYESGGDLIKDSNADGGGARSPPVNRSHTLPLRLIPERHF